MDITWDSADPAFLFGVLHRLCVRVNGEDVGVWELWDTHMDVCDWDSDGGALGKRVRPVPWDEVREIHVY